MIVFDIYGGPGSGKSVAAAALYVGLKNKGIRAALVGEAATELILNHQTEVLKTNQHLVCAMQYERLLRLDRSGCKVAISDSPLKMQEVYNSIDFNQKIITAANKYNTYSVYVHRANPTDTYGRTESSLNMLHQLDAKIFELGQPYWLRIDGNKFGQEYLVNQVAQELEIYDVTY